MWTLRKRVIEITYTTRRCAIVGSYGPEDSEHFTVEISLHTLRLLLAIYYANVKKIDMQSNVLKMSK